MPCNLTKSLQESVVNNTRLLNAAEWEPHLKTCDPCFQEAKTLDQSLDLYLQLEHSATTRLPEIEIWKQLEEKMNAVPRRTYYLKSFSKQTKGLAVAAVFLLLFGVSMWWQSSNSMDPRFLATVSGLPPNYRVEEIKMDQPFGPPSAQTRLIWTKKHFGISIENTAQGNYPTISIGMRLSEEVAQTPNFKMNTSPELAYLLPHPIYH